MLASKQATNHVGRQRLEASKPWKQRLDANSVAQTNRAVDAAATASWCSGVFFCQLLLR